jgi:hypothetical protein
MVFVAPWIVTQLPRLNNVETKQPTASVASWQSVVDNDRIYCLLAHDPTNALRSRPKYKLLDANAM